MISMDGGNAIGLPGTILAHAPATHVHPVLNRFFAPAPTIGAIGEIDILTSM
jgi:hypothetical protein